MNSRILKGLEKLGLISLVNSVTQMLTRYHSDRAGLIMTKPEYFGGRPLNSTVSGDLSEGMFVVRVSEAAQASDETDGPTALFNICPAGARPHGMLEKKEGEDLLVRTMRGDIAVTGITAGADYVVGTDGKPAKVGDSNYPTGVASPVVVAIGWLTDVLMLGVSSSAEAVSFRGRIAADSTELVADTLTDFSQTLAMDLTQLKVGDEVEIAGQIKLVTPNLVTFQPKVLIGAVEVFLPRAIDPNNGGDVLGFRVLMTVRSVGATGKFISFGSINVLGEITTATSSGGGQGDETTLDYTQTAAVLKVQGVFSAAGANSAFLRKLTYRRL